MAPLKIDDKTFLNRAFKAYDNPHCVSISEFQEDLSRFSYIKKILTQYEQSGEINERLLLNHIVVCFNLFGGDALSFLLFRVDERHWKYLFPFLLLLNRLPEEYIKNFFVDEEITRRLKAL